MFGVSSPRQQSDNKTTTSRQQSELKPSRGTSFYFEIMSTADQIAALCASYRRRAVDDLHLELKAELLVGMPKLLEKKLPGFAEKRREWFRSQAGIRFDNLPEEEQLRRLWIAEARVLEPSTQSAQPAQSAQQAVAEGSRKRSAPGRPPSNPKNNAPEKRARLREALMAVTGGSEDSIDVAEAILNCLKDTEKEGLRALLPESV